MQDLAAISDLTWDLKLLYVEDNPEARKSTVALLEDFFENITVAVDGEDGLDKFKNDSFDLVITDINMPKLDGLAMSKEIRKIDSTTPIIVISAHQESDFLTKSIKIKIDGYLFKPLDIDQFASSIEKAAIEIINRKELELSQEKQKKKEIRRTEKIISRATRQDIDQRNLVKEIEAMHKHTRESIEYAALIQGAVLPDEDLMRNYFPDYFVHWEPKDTVGGDIWLFNELRHEDECLLFFIDCTGHGVPGAFVTMIVKAIEREIVSKIKENDKIDISPAWIMGYFNETMKVLLKQETKDSKSNAGWDGGIIYYNKQTQILKFAGAETPLFYVDTDGSFNTIKGNRYSVGYKKCAMDYQYKETILEVKEGMKFYCTTDGYIDQNGGEKDFPFGKKRFGNIIKEHHTKPMSEKKEIFIDEMAIYENMIENNDRNDDMTVIAFEIGQKSTNKLLYSLLKYDGELTQGIIAHSMEIIEKKIENMGMMGKAATASVELLQNMMKYSKSDKLGCRDIYPSGFFNILKDEDETYYLNSKNIMSIEDKEKVEVKLIEIKSLDASALKKRYRELRKSGENTHSKGGGIGFYEIAKQLTSFEYNFTAINDEKFYFEYMAVIKSKKRD